MEKKNNLYSDDLDNISVKEIADILISEKLKLSTITGLALILSTFLSLYIPNQYLSYSVLAPSTSMGNSSKLSSQYSGVASLAGISLPSSKSDKTFQAIEVMKSLDFFKKLITKHDLEIPIMAVNGWTRDSNQIKINKNIYDIKNKKWVSNIKFSVDGKPSIQYAHRIFLKNLSIEVDRKTEFITVSYKHYSPHIAKEIVDLIIIEINRIIKEDDVKHAELSIKFLEKELKYPQIEEIKETLNSLVESNYKTIILANSSPEYLFRILSPSFSPEIKSSPTRIYIVIGITLISFIITSLYLIIKFYIRNS